jgi:6-phosphogluconate dehydrogenase
MMRFSNSHEPLFYSFAKNVQHTGDMPGSGHFAKMVLDGLECAMFQVVGDAFAYCNGNVPVMLSLMDKAKNMDVSGPVIDRCKSQLYVTRNYSQVAQVKNSTTWFMEYTFKARLPTPVIHSAITSRMTSQYAKLSETHQSYNTFYDTNVIQGNQISYGKIEHWSKNSNVACRMFETHDPLYVMDATVEFARTFVMHCVNSGVPIPTVQAALSQYRTNVDEFYRVVTRRLSVAP